MPVSAQRDHSLHDEGRSHKKPMISHLWWDYVPESFIEPHKYLRREGIFRSTNLVANLWDNGKTPDCHTHFIRRRRATNLINPSFLFRLANRLSRSWKWRTYRKFITRKNHELRPALFHSHFGTTACEIHKDIAKTKIPHLVTLYGYDASAALLKPALAEKYKEMFKSAHRIIVLCKVAKDRLVALGCSATKVIVWNMPAGVELYPFVVRPQEKEFRLIMAARFAEAKGHSYLIDALDLLVKRGHSIHLTLIGYGNFLGKITAQIERLGLSSHATIIDNQLTGNFSENYREQLAKSDLFVLPSIRDSHGTDEAGPALTMVCAQASGLPVVCTPFPGSEISLIDGVTGHYCLEKNSAALADKIEIYIKNRGLIERMGRRGSELVNREFSEWIQMEKLYEIYRETMGITKTASQVWSPAVFTPAPLPPAMRPADREQISHTTSAQN